MLTKKDFPLILGMIQPEPCPGSFKNKGMKIDEIINISLKEVEMLQKYGFDGYIIQNRNDAPIRQKAEVQSIAYMTAISRTLKQAFPKMIQGILVNWDGVASLAVADAAGADFVRIEHTMTGVEVGYAGFMEAQCVDVCEFRKKIDTDIPVYADLHEIHYAQIGDKGIDESARDLIQNAFVDGIFAGGKNLEESLEIGKIVRKRIGEDAIMMLSSGSTAENIKDILSVYDGVSVGTWIKNGNLRNPIDEDRARRFMQAVNEFKENR